MKKSIWKLVGLLLLLPLFAGCNDTDDVAAIFTGSWKLTYITVKDGNKMIDLWGGNTEAEKTSMKLLEGAKNFTITFSAPTSDNETATGSVGGQIPDQTFSGTWTANGKNNTFRIIKFDQQLGNQSDALAKEFKIGLETANSYEGDSRNLFLYYSSGNQTRCLAFAPSRN